MIPTHINSYVLPPPVHDWLRSEMRIDHTTAATPKQLFIDLHTICVNGLSTPVGNAYSTHTITPCVYDTAPHLCDTPSCQ